MEELLKQMKIDLEAFNNISNVTLPPEQQNTLKFDFDEDEVVLKIRKENNNMLDDLFYELSGLASEDCDEDEDEQFHQGYIAGLNHALAIIEERRDMYERGII